RLNIQRPTNSTRFPYTTLFRSRDHGLKVEERFEAALRYLGLVGRVGRVPGGVLEHVATDHRGGVRAVETLTDHLGVDRVLCGERDRKSTRLNSSHVKISYAVFC